VVGKVGNVDYKLEMASGKVKTFHINMLKYYQRVWRQAGSSFHEREGSLIKRTNLEVARPGQGVHSPDGRF